LNHVLAGFANVARARSKQSCLFTGWLKEIEPDAPMTLSNSAPPFVSRQTKAFAPWNLFSALVLLPEQGPGRAIARTLHDYGMQVHSAATALEAAQLFRSRRLDLVLFDSDLSWAGQLGFLEPSNPWRGVAMALTASKRGSLRGKRVHFVLPKPVSADLLARGLKAAYTNMAQQRVATYRHSVPARLVSGTLSHRGWQRTLHQVNVVNLSQTGLCLNAAEPLPHGASLAMSLVLPESPASLHATGSVIWSHSNGRTGVAFDRSTCPEMRKLQERLNMWLPPELGMVARLG
jgi:PilZ domain